MTCPLCGGAEHRDADQMGERCDVVVIERFPCVYLRDLGMVS